jgi:membrane protease YdiL (CAAX protease family)
MKVLGRWATAGFAVLAFVLGGVIAWAVVEITIPASLNFDRSSDGSSTAVGGLVFNSVIVVALVLTSRRSRSDVFAYLGLDVPRWQHITAAMAGLAIWIAVTDTLHMAQSGVTVGWRSLLIHHSAQKDGLLIWLWLETVVAAPIGEELLFRGFMFRGFVHAPRDAIPGIVLISLIWSLLHVQYDWLFIAEVFVLGLLFGLVRWRTGSTTLTILLHMLFNLEHSIETVLVVG